MDDLVWILFVKGQQKGDRVRLELIDNQQLKVTVLSGRTETALYITTCLRYWRWTTFYLIHLPYNVLVTVDVYVFTNASIANTNVMYKAVDKNSAL